MSLKKFLKRLTTNSQTATKLMSPRGSIDSGQVIIEYFILLVILTAFTMIASSTFFKQTQYMTERFTNEAVNKIAPNVW